MAERVTPDSAIEGDRVRFWYSGMERIAVVLAARPAGKNFEDGSKLWGVCDYEVIEAAPNQTAAGEQRPRIVTLCGSMRFEEQMRDAAIDESLAGRIVLAPFVNMRTNDPRFFDAEKIKEDLDRLHFAKIDLADEILVVTVGGYIGTSTHREITYAEKHGKPVRYQDFPEQRPVVDSELRDRIAAEIPRHRYWHPGSCECGWKVDKDGDGNWSVQFDAHVAQSIVNTAVAPVLAARDRLLAQSDEQWEQAEAELKRERESRRDLTDALALSRSLAKLRSREYGRASATIGQLRAQLARNHGGCIEHERRLDDRQKLADHMVDSLRGERIVLWEERDKLRAELAEANSELRARAPIFEAAMDTSAELVRVSAQRDAAVSLSVDLQVKLDAAGGQLDTEATKQVYVPTDWQPSDDEEIDNPVSPTVIDAPATPTKPSPDWRHVDRSKWDPSPEACYPQKADGVPTEPRGGEA